MLEGYKNYFWNWCKEHHPEILFEFRDDMKKSIEELEEFTKMVEKTRKKSGVETDHKYNPLTDGYI